MEGDEAIAREREVADDAAFPLFLKLKKALFSDEEAPRAGRRSRTTTAPERPTASETPAVDEEK